MISFLVFVATNPLLALALVVCAALVVLLLLARWTFALPDSVERRPRAGRTRGDVLREAGNGQVNTGDLYMAPEDRED